METEFHFSQFPVDVKLEILRNVLEPKVLAGLSLVCKEWRDLANDDFVWKPLFLRDFGDWIWSEENSHRDAEDSFVKRFSSGYHYKDKYLYYFIKGWQWDLNKKHSNIVVTNNSFTTYLQNDMDIYHGVRTTKGVNSGIHNFEVLIELPTDLAAEKLLDKGRDIFFGLGIATDTFDPSNCNSGFTTQNHGIGYYNDGRIFITGEYGSASIRRKTKLRSGDRFGFELNLNYPDASIMFYVNGEVVSQPVPLDRNQVDRVYFPHLILTRYSKCVVTIISNRRDYPSHGNEDGGYVCCYVDL